MASRTGGRERCTLNRPPAPPDGRFSRVRQQALAASVVGAASPPLRTSDTSASPGDSATSRRKSAIALIRPKRQQIGCTSASHSAKRKSRRGFAYSRFRASRRYVRRRSCPRSGAQVLSRLRTTSRMLGDAAVGARPGQQRRRVATTGGYLVTRRGVSSARVQRPRAVRTRLPGCEDALPSLPFVRRGAPVRVSQRNRAAGPPTIRRNVLLRRRPRW